MFVEKTPDEIAAMNPDQLAVYNKEKAAAEKEAKKIQKGPKTLTDVYASYADQATAKDNFEFSLLESYDVEFTSEFRRIKKGHKMFGISKVAFDLYNLNGVVKQLKKTEAPNIEENA
jgi:hypothetical protein